ncbi:MAG: peptidase M4 [Bacteroidetes bacterium HGW-Bacteroidetes-4]|jgi:Zn-dependent metalloprotease/chitodextrinase|nr:MAG: peptidase M4 [Bacteroidetes bacterium HGW-Bacteroidetes-4]
MKHVYQKVLMLVLLAFFGLASSAQQKGAIKQQVLDEKGRPTLIEFNVAAKAYVAQQPEQLFRDVLNLRSNESYREAKSHQDELGMVHQKYQQTYRNIPVEFGTYTIHSKEGQVFALSGIYKEIQNVDLAHVLTEAEALEKALSYVGAQNYMWEDGNNEQWLKNEKNNASATWFPKGELVIVENAFAKTKEEHVTPSYAYKFDVYATNPVSRAYIYVDAKTGKIVNHNAIIKSAVANGNGDTRYSGNRNFTTDSYNSSYRLRDYSRGNGIITYDMNTSTNYNSAVDFTDANNSWTYAEYHNTAKDDIAMECHWAFQQIYDYWLNIHNRNSFDGSGALMKAYVHFDNAYDNAYWNGSVFTFGDGSNTYFDALASLDVSAHEHGHAVCTYTADLVYQNESGALNEAFSDIWGACVEAYAAPEKNIWVMGEDIERRSGHEGLRILSNPNAEGLPDTYGGTYWAPLASNPTSSNDYGGVHTNNGPFCYWFYLISEGGSGTNDNGDSYSVTGLGITKAEKIAWRMESVYLSASSNYANARTYAIQSATDLYGATSNEVIQVTNAMYAIGVGSAYGGGSTPSYCASKGSNFSYEWIASVKVGAYTKTSGAAGYSNFTSETVALTPGQSYAITLTPGFASTTYNEYWKIWIDYNGDMDFADAGELVFDAGAMSKAAVSGTINIPSSATGTTRMRVSMKYNGAQTECETFSYGEVEDYTVEFTSGGADTQAPTAPSSLTASSVTQTTVNLAWNASTDNVGVTAYIVYQGATALGTTTATSAQITGLTAGTSYSFSVKAQDAAGNISAASNTVNVTTQSASDTQVPTVPTNLAASGVSTTSLTLSWNASTDNVGVTGYQVFQNGSLVKTVTGTSTSMTGLTAATTYSFYVKAADAAGNVSGASNTINVTTLSGTISYCASKGNNSTYEWIDLVQVGGINNVSGNNGGYANNTSMLGTVALGANTIYFSAGFRSSSYTEYWHVWVDLNHDGVFGTDERLVYGSSSSSGTLSATMTIPTTALLGQTRMRVTMKYNAAATACETFSYGEVEDYTLTIVSSTYNVLASSFEAAEALSSDELHDFMVFPNPVQNDLNISFAGMREVVLTIYDVSGRTVIAEPLFNQEESLDVSGLAKGIYTLILDDGNKQISTRFIKQ